MWLYFISHNDIYFLGSRPRRRVPPNIEDIKSRWDDYEVKYRGNFFSTNTERRDPLADDPNYPPRRYPYRYRTTFKDSDLVGVISYSPDASGYAGNLGFICSMSDDAFADPNGLLLPDENKILFVSLSSHLPEPERGSLRRFLLARPKDLGAENINGGELINVYDMQGMLLSSPDNENRAFIPPFKKGEREHALINGATGEAMGAIRPSDGEKDDEGELEMGETKISLEGRPALHGTEEVGGRKFEVKKEMKVDGDAVGAIYSYKSYSGGDMFTDINANRLFARSDDAHATQAGLLFAYYHLKRLGNALSVTERWYYYQ